METGLKTFSDVNFRKLNHRFRLSTKKRCKPVTIGTSVYPSVVEAARAAGISPTQLIHLLKTTKQLKDGTPICRGERVVADASI